MYPHLCLHLSFLLATGPLQAGCENKASAKLHLRFNHIHQLSGDHETESQPKFPNYPVKKIIVDTHKKYWNLRKPRAKTNKMEENIKRNEKTVKQSVTRILRKLRTNFSAVQLFSKSMSKTFFSSFAHDSSRVSFVEQTAAKVHRTKGNSINLINKMLIKSIAALKIWFCFQVVSAILTNRTDDFVDFTLTQPHPEDKHYAQSNKCTNRLHTSLEKLRRRQAHLKSTAFIDLSGYALHQTLRHVPLDMYVTDIRVKTPGVGDWVRIQKCQFSNRDNRMTTQILFNDLTVSGTVQLLEDSEVLKNSFHPIPREFCKMSLRLQRAGLGINAFPTRGRSRGIEVKTEARFMDPKFLSVHAYGCKLNDIFKRADEGYSSDPNGKYVESEIPDQQDYPLNQTEKYAWRRQRSDDATNSQEGDSEVRIITLNPDIRAGEDSSKWFNLNREDDSGLNDFHRQRILSMRLHSSTERDRLKAVLHIKNLIAQQANHMFQTQGPFSQVQKPYFNPHRPGPYLKPGGPGYAPAHTVVSSITELDENLSPIRPVPQRPFEALFSPNEQIINQQTHPGFNNYFEEVSREMEDIFLRGIKTLLTRYVEKQLEIPLKEALMVNFGYTVSYG